MLSELSLLLNTPMGRGTQQRLLPDKRKFLPPWALYFPRRLLRCKHMIHSRMHINFLRVIRPCIAPRPDAMSAVEQKEHGNAHIRREERTHVPVLGPEDVEAVDQT